MRVPPPLAFVITTFIWGTTWLAIKIGYAGLDAVWGASLRFLIAGVLFTPFIVAKGLAPPRGRRQLLVVTSLAICMFTIDYGLIYVGEQHLPSGLTAVLLGTLPLFLGLLSIPLQTGDRFKPWQWAGLTAGMLGLVLLFADDLSRGADLLPTFAIVLASFAAAVGTVIVRKWGHDIPPIVLNASSMFLGGLVLLPISLAYGETPALPANASAWASLGYLVLFGSIIAFLLYWDLMRAWGATRAGLVVILTPVVALFVGALYGERLTLQQWVGSFIVLAGVALALRPRIGRAASAHAAATSGGK